MDLLLIEIKTHIQQFFFFFFLELLASKSFLDSTWQLDYVY